MKRSAPPLGTLLKRGLLLRCPRCGGAPLFKSYFRMHADCPECGFHFERDPGYFLGSVYLNYGLTGIVLTIAYMVLHFGFALSNRALLVPLSAWCVVFPLVFFRFARALWLAMDCFFDNPDRVLPTAGDWVATADREPSEATDSNGATPP